MMSDRNKTDLTKEVTSAAIAYLDERGFKPIETEVQVETGWVADIASVIDPTNTEMIALKLARRCPAWTDPARVEWSEAMERSRTLMTALVEVKTSRGDFCGDPKWARPAPANLAYLATPDGLIADEELPAGWGHLSLNTSGVMSLKRVPSIHSVTVAQQLSVVLQVAIRRDHDTRYERLRGLMRRQRESRNEQLSITRVLNAMMAMEAIVRGKHGSIETALSYHGIKRVPEYHMRTLETLWAVAAPRTVERTQAGSAADSGEAIPK